nr:TonB-dependent receptor [Mucilaginibacter robiniae]
MYGSGANYLGSAGITPSQLANPNLTWESTRQVDLGTEFSVLNNRLTFSFDYYNKYTYNVLLNVPVPSRSGFTTYLQNYGAVRNKGEEFAIHSLNIANEHFKWTADFNISFNKNRIEKLASDITQGASGRNISILRQGYPVNSFYLYKQLSVDPQTGNAIYEDVNKDGQITSADRQIVGNAQPKYTGGFTNTFTYRNFDLSAFFYFNVGNKIMNMNDFFLVHGGTQANIGFIPRQLQRWITPGQITDIPRMTTSNIDPATGTANPAANDSPANNYGGNVANLSSRYLQDGSFLRLKTLTIGYTLSPAWLKRASITRARIYFQATNLITWTKYDGLDPEVSSQSNNQNTAGYDWATVPQPRTLQVGANVTF